MVKRPWGLWSRPNTLIWFSVQLLFNTLALKNAGWVGVECLLDSWAADHGERGDIEVFHMAPGKVCSFPMMSPLHTALNNIIIVSPVSVLPHAADLQRGRGPSGHPNTAVVYFSNLSLYIWQCSLTEWSCLPYRDSFVSLAVTHLDGRNQIHWHSSSRCCQNALKVCRNLFAPIRRVTYCKCPEPPVCTFYRTPTPVLWRS